MNNKGLIIFFLILVFGLIYIYRDKLFKKRQQQKVDEIKFQLADSVTRYTNLDTDGVPQPNKSVSNNRLSSMNEINQAVSLHDSVNISGDVKNNPGYDLKDFV